MAVGKPREQLLDEHGLDEARFEQLEQAVEAELERAMSQEGDAVPPFLVAYEAALRRAQTEAHGPTTMTLAEFAGAIAALERGGDPRHTLEKLGVSAHDLSRALAHFGPLLAKDSGLAAQFAALRAGKQV